VKPTIIAAALALTIGGVAFPACNSQNSDNMKDRVSAALKNANMKDVDVDYDRNERVVHLKGSVDSPAERARAEQLAAGAVGTSGRVLNEVTVKGVDEKTADDNDGRIKDQLKDAVDRDPQLKNENVDFSVNNGAVEISGSVASAAEKSRVTEMARSVAGVKDVANALEVKGEEAAGTSGRRAPADQRR
jgi:hyperosmotically inducible periplasmic protein